jgi:hypothetical protein
MNNEPTQDFTPIEELIDIPLSDLVEPQCLELPEIEPQDFELPTDYLQDLIQRGVIGEDTLTIDIDPSLLEGPEPEHLPFVQRDEPTQGQEEDFGR